MRPPVSFQKSSFPSMTMAGTFLIVTPPRTRLLIRTQELFFTPS